MSYSPHDTGRDIEISDNPLDTVRLGTAHQMEGLIQLELTAERMVEDEALLINAYLTDDLLHAKGFWREFKDDVELMEYEIGQWLLSAADPSRVEWQDKHWWGTEEDDLRH